MVFKIFDVYELIFFLGVVFFVIVKCGKMLLVVNVLKEWIDFDVECFFCDGFGCNIVFVNDVDVVGVVEVCYGVVCDVFGFMLLIMFGIGIGFVFLYDGVLLLNIELGYLNFWEYEFVEIYVVILVCEWEGFSWVEWVECL